MAGREENATKIRLNAMRWAHSRTTSSNFGWLDEHHSQFDTGLPKYRQTRANREKSRKEVTPASVYHFQANFLYQEVGELNLYLRVGTPQKEHWRPSLPHLLYRISGPTGNHNPLKLYSGLV